MGAREGIMTLADGCLAVLGEGSDRSALPGHARVARAGVVGRLGRRPPRRVRGGPLRGRDPEDCLRFAVACGAESTQHFGAGVLEQREVERLLPEVRVETFEAPAIQVG